MKRGQKRLCVGDEVNTKRTRSGKSYSSRFNEDESEESSSVVFDLEYLSDAPGATLFQSNSDKVEIMSNNYNGVVLLDQRREGEEVVLKLPFKSVTARNEVEILKVLSGSSYVPKFNRAWLEPSLPQTRGTQQVVISLEYIPSAKVQLASFKNYATGLLKALAYLHQKNVIHGDIRPANCLLTPAGSVVIIDFGFSGTVEEDGKKEVLGSTLYYSAPEVSLDRVGIESDVFSAGVALLTVLLRLLPSKNKKEFRGSESVKSFHNSSRSSLSSFKRWFISEFLSCELPWISQFLALVYKMVQLEPSARTLCDRLLNHPFFTQTYDDQTEKENFVPSIHTTSKNKK